VNGVSAAIRAAEHEVLLGGHPVELTLDNVTALAHPLHEEESAGPGVRRGGRGPQRPALRHERAGALPLPRRPGGVSIANVGLHETVERQAVTDELTASPTGAASRRSWRTRSSASGASASPSASSCSTSTTSSA
jgi:hypothetical protein